MRLIKLYIKLNRRVMNSVRDDVLTAVLLNSRLFCDITFSRLLYRPKRAYYLENGDSKLFRNSGNCIPNSIASHPTRLIFKANSVVKCHLQANEREKSKENTLGPDTSYKQLAQSIDKVEINGGL